MLEQNRAERGASNLCLPRLPLWQKPQQRCLYYLSRSPPMSPASPKRCVGRRPVSPAEDLPAENLRERSAIRRADHWGGSILAPSVLEDVRSRLRGAKWLNVTNADLFYTSRGSRGFGHRGDTKRRHPAATIDPSVGHCLDLSSLCQSGTLEFRSESVHRLSPRPAGVDRSARCAMPRFAPLDVAASDG